MNDKTKRLFLSFFYVFLFVCMYFVPFAGRIVYASEPESYSESIPESSEGTPESTPEDIPEASTDTVPDISVEPPSDHPVSDDIPSEDRSEDSLFPDTNLSDLDEPEIQDPDILLPDTPDSDSPEPEIPVSDGSSANVPQEEDLSDGESDYDPIQTFEQPLISDVSDIEEPELLFFDKDFADYTVAEGLLLLIFVVLFCDFCISMTAKIMNWRMY